MAENDTGHIESAESTPPATTPKTGHGGSILIIAGVFYLSLILMVFVVLVLIAMRS